VVTSVGTAASGPVTAVDFTIQTTTGGRVTYTGTATKVFHVSATLCMTGTNGATYGFKLAKGLSGGAASVIDSTEILRKLGTGADVGAAAIQGFVSLATGDWIELFVDSTVNADSTLALAKLNLSISEV